MSGYPRGLEVTERWPGAASLTYSSDDAARLDDPRGRDGSLVDHAVILVHGSLDRASSFRRVARRLEEFLVVTYDRRGYHHSRALGVPADLPTDLPGHVRDLVEIGEEVARRAVNVTVVGQSFGGDVAIAAAISRPDLFKSLGAFEPPMPWYGFQNRSRDHRSTDSLRTSFNHDALERYASAANPPPLSNDPETEVVAFFSRMVGGDVWDRMPESMREERIKDGPALIGDLRSFRTAAPFEITDLKVPALFGRGGEKSAAHHREGVAWLASTVPRAAIYEIENAGHGAHLSHPNAFASFVRAALAFAHHRDPTVNDAAAVE
ncbi:MAG: alpha/beta fold hydrolase [Acidimicrobiales bacterium]|jgi:pimeloyl-ACP methyl ester carboxylesterase